MTKIEVKIAQSRVSNSSFPCQSGINFSLFLSVFSIFQGCMLLLLFGTWAPRITLFFRMRGLSTAAVRRHMGPAVSTLASFCLQKSHAWWVSACFQTPRLSIGHQDSFKSAHDLKCMCTQTSPLFNIPRTQEDMALP